jgi:hypothetical protein
MDPSSWIFTDNVTQCKPIRLNQNTNAKYPDARMQALAQRGIYRKVHAPQMYA